MKFMNYHVFMNPEIPTRPTSTQRRDTGHSAVTVADPPQTSAEMAQALAVLQRDVSEMKQLLHQIVQAQPDPLGAAKARGAAAIQQEMQSPDNLSLSQASAYVGVSEHTLNERRNLGRYYALAPVGSQRGFRYPRWQFDAEEQRLSPALAALDATRASCWVKHQFLLQPSEWLAGRSPREVVLDGSAAMDLLMLAIQRRFGQDQGAL